jgi:hypothetical protein
MTAPKALDWEKDSEDVHEHQKSLTQFQSEKNVIEGEVIEEPNQDLKRGS